jgi:hypothetical protein
MRNLLSLTLVLVTEPAKVTGLSALSRNPNLDKRAPSRACLGVRQPQLAKGVILNEEPLPLQLIAKDLDLK